MGLSSLVFTRDQRPKQMDRGLKVVTDGSGIDVLPVNKTLADEKIAGSHDISSEQVKTEDDDADDDSDFMIEPLLSDEDDKAGAEDGSDEGEYDAGVAIEEVRKHIKITGIL